MCADCVEFGYGATMRFEVEFDREDDGRWIAEIVNLPGAMAYGETREIALAAVEAIAQTLSL